MIGKSWKFLRVIMPLLSFALILGIFLFSSETGTLSGQRSQKIVETVNALLSCVGLRSQLTEYSLRKLAHFSEYLTLGILMMVTTRVYTRHIFSCLGWLLFEGVFLSILDETLQLFVTDRVGHLGDVWIDFSGYLCGVLLTLLVIWILQKNSRIAE